MKITSSGEKTENFSPLSPDIQVYVPSPLVY